jgi:hypothetical protein
MTMGTDERIAQALEQLVKNTERIASALENKDVGPPRGAGAPREDEATRGAGAPRPETTTEPWGQGRAGVFRVGEPARPAEEAVQNPEPNVYDGE